MKTAIIILNYNDCENTKKYVESIASYENIHKIIVVDNHSTKVGELEQLNVLRSEKTEVIVTDQNGGYAYGNNFGVRFLNEKYPEEYAFLIISNPDVSVSEDAIDRCVDYLSAHETCAIAAPRMVFPGNRMARRSSWRRRDYWIDVANSTRLTEFLLYPLFQRGMYQVADFEKKELSVDAIAGAFFVVKNAVFEKVGYFDEATFLFYEEDILAEKLKKSGYTIVSLNDSTFTHFDSQTIGRIMNLFKKQEYLFESKKYFHQTYNHAGKLALFFLTFLLYWRKMELLFEVPLRKFVRKNR